MGLVSLFEVWARAFCYGEPRPWGELVIQGLVCGGLTCACIIAWELASFNATLLLLLYSLNSCWRLSCDMDSLVTAASCGLGESVVGSVLRDSPVGRASNTACTIVGMSSRVSDCLPLPISGEWPLLLCFPGGADDVFPPLPRFPRPRGAIVLVSLLAGLRAWPGLLTGTHNSR